jgi:hypothetical protein
MKKILLVIIIFLCNLNSYSQDVYEKYNDLTETYEYYNSNNELIGYKRYNEIMERWEYHSVKDKQNSYRNKKIISPDNSKNVSRVLLEKQRRHDKNFNKLKRLIRDLKSRIDGISNNTRRRKAHELLNDAIVKFEKKFDFDYSNSSHYRSWRKYLINSFEAIIDYVYEKFP